MLNVVESGTRTLTFQINTCTYNTGNLSVHLDVIMTSDEVPYLPPLIITTTLK